MGSNQKLTMNFLNLIHPQSKSLVADCRHSSRRKSTIPSSFLRYQHALVIFFIGTDLQPNLSNSMNSMTCILFEVSYLALSDSVSVSLTDRFAI